MQHFKTSASKMHVSKLVHANVAIFRRLDIVQKWRPSGRKSFSASSSRAHKSSSFTNQSRKTAGKPIKNGHLRPHQTYRLFCAMTSKVECDCAIQNDNILMYLKFMASKNSRIFQTYQSCESGHFGGLYASKTCVLKNPTRSQGL